jgi:hypothetical protein
MRGIRQRAGALLLVALLVVPVVASAHTHGALAASRTCATCVTAHHSPAIVMPAVGPVAAFAPVLAAAPPPAIVPACPLRSPRSGRAPPSLGFPSIV